MSAEPLSDERIHAAIRYLLQLAVEYQTDRASYADGTDVLEQVASVLEAHCSHRRSMKRIALVAELVEPIHERLKLVAGGAVMRSDAYGTISRWLRRKGIKRTPDEVAELLERPIRNGAKRRTARERLLDRLAFLLGISQSQLEKVVGVAERGKPTKGRLGTPLLHERAAIDPVPSRTELLVYALHALGVDADTGQRIVALFGEEQLDAVYDSIEERAQAAEVLDAAKKAARVNRTSPRSPKSPPSRTTRK